MRMNPPKRISQTTKMWKRLVAVGPKGLPAGNVRKRTVKEGTVMGTAGGATSIPVGSGASVVESANSVQSSAIARSDARKHRIDVIRDVAGGSGARTDGYRELSVTKNVQTVGRRDAISLDARRMGVLMMRSRL